MKNHGKMNARVCDVAKKLGIQTQDLIRECAECDIIVTSTDTLDLDTYKYVLSGMYAGEYEWGEHLHLENGEVASHINRSHMRAKDKSEYTVSGEMKASALATKLGIPLGILLNELKVHWYTYTKNDLVSLGEVKSIMDDLEVHTSRDQLAGSCDTSDHAHCLHDGASDVTSCDTVCDTSADISHTTCDTSSCEVVSQSGTCGTDACASTTTDTGSTTVDTYTTQQHISSPNTTKIADLAIQLGVPATAFVARLHSQGIQDTVLDATQVQTITDTTSAGNIDWGQYTLSEMSGCAEGETCPSHARYASADTSTTTHQVVRTHTPMASRVVASSDDEVGVVAAASGFKNLRSAIALGLLWFLAVPLLFGLFGEKGEYGSSAEVVDTATPSAEIHAAADPAIDTAPEIVPTVDRSLSHLQVISASPVPSVAAPAPVDQPVAVVPARPVPTQPEQITQKTKKFVENLVDSVNNAEFGAAPTSQPAVQQKALEHNAATAPTRLPATGVAQ